MPTSVDSPVSGATSALRPFSPGRVVRPLDRRQVDEPALSLGDRADQDRIVQRQTGRLHLEDGVAGSDLAAHDLVAVMAGQQRISATSARNIFRAWSSSDTIAVSSCGLRWRIRVDS